MFNKYVWNTYLEGKGKDIVAFFEENLLQSFSDKYADKICELHKFFCPCAAINNSIREQLSESFKVITEGQYLLEEGEYTIESAVSCLFDYCLEEASSPQRAFDYFSGSMSFFTTILARELPDLVIPYYFKYNFNVFEKISKEFCINLPPIPIKKDYTGRFMYYARVCEALYDFRIEHEMTPYELCAFLYDFAPKYIGGIDSYIIEDLPEPKSAYFIGGSADDYLLSNDESTITAWQCNPDTMAGDMIVMYLRTPISAVDSIWRSVSPGFNDPFFYYYRCTYISKPCKIRKISQKQMGRDAIFKQMPIVKKNMQGINGVELLPSAYNHMVELSKKDLPKLEFVVESDNLELTREKDVENKLIKPFLAELGYSESEYIQQLYIEIGNRNHALIPDFVVHPVVSKGHQSAEFLVEAKFSVNSAKFLDEVKTQARGYAKLLDARYSVIAAKEGIWITGSSDDYTKTVLSYTWQELKNADNFHEVFNLLGNGKMNEKK